MTYSGCLKWIGFWDGESALYDLAIECRVKLSHIEKCGVVRKKLYFTASGEANNLDWFRRKALVLAGEDDPGPDPSLVKQTISSVIGPSSGILPWYGRVSG